MKNAAKKTLAVAMTAATLLAVPAASMGAFAAGNTDSVQMASASDVTYIENHSVIDCGSYYTEGANYCFLIKIPNGAPISSVTVKNTFTGETNNLADVVNGSYQKVTYQYSDSTSDCYLYSVYIYPSCPKYMWYEYGIKLYYDYNGSHYMATNTSYNSTTEGNGYILKR